MGEIVELTYVCSSPDLAGNPVVLTVFVGERRIDEIAFYHSQSITKQYVVPDSFGEEKELFFSVSRTWNLKKLGVADDSRNLGVAIHGPQVLPGIPEEGIGFYHWEEWQEGALPGQDEDSFAFRWTDRKAVFYPEQLTEKNVLYLRAGQPGVEREPLLVEIRQGGRVVKEVQLKDTDWHRVVVDFGEDLLEPWSIVVSRTWNPAKEGFGNDSRFLGVAVAGFGKAGE